MNKIALWRSDFVDPDTFEFAVLKQLGIDKKSWKKVYLIKITITNMTQGSMIEMFDRELHPLKSA